MVGIPTDTFEGGFSAIPCRTDNTATLDAALIYSLKNSPNRHISSTAQGMYIFTKIFWKYRYSLKFQDRGIHIFPEIKIFNKRRFLLAIYHTIHIMFLYILERSIYFTSIFLDFVKAIYQVDMRPTGLWHPVPYTTIYLQRNARYLQLYCLCNNGLLIACIGMLYRKLMIFL